MPQLETKKRSESKEVKSMEINLRVGNGAKVAAERVDNYRLDLLREIDCLT